MNIAYFTHLYYNAKSGPGRFAEHLRGYSSDEIKFIFFTDDHRPGLGNNKIKITNCPILNKLPGYWLIRSFLFFQATRKSSILFDAIICSNAFEGFLLTIFVKKIPVLIMINDDNYIYTRNHYEKVKNHYSLRKTLSRFFGYYIEKMVAQRALGIIVCSNYLKDMIAYNYGIQAHKIHVIYPAVDLKIFRPLNGKSDKLKNETLRVLFAKNDWRRGGLDIIMEGLAIYNGSKKIHLTIAGVPEGDKQEIISTASNFGIKENISIEGVVSKEELLKKMGENDILVLCSRQEAFGILLLEAMATGIPIIASYVGGIPEVLDNGKAGFLISPESPHELMAIVTKLVDEPDLVMSKIEHGLEHVKKFSTNILYSNLESLLLSFEKVKE